MLRIKFIAFITLMLSVTISTAFCQEKTIPTSPAGDFDYYAEIGFLTQGRPVWLSSPDSSGAEGYVYRVVILYQEIYSFVLFETISIRGIEGSKRKVESVRYLNSYKLGSAFDFEYKGE